MPATHSLKRSLFARNHVFKSNVCTIPISRHPLAALPYTLLKHFRFQRQNKSLLYFLNYRQCDEKCKAGLGRYYMTFPANYNLTKPKEENIRCVQCKKALYDLGIAEVATPGGYSDCDGSV